MQLPPRLLLLLLLVLLLRRCSILRTPSRFTCRRCATCLGRGAAGPVCRCCCPRRPTVQLGPASKGGGDTATREWLDAFLKPWKPPPPAAPPARLAAGLEKGSTTRKRKTAPALLKDGAAGLKGNANDALGEAIAPLVKADLFVKFKDENTGKEDCGRCFAEQALTEAGFTYFASDFDEYWSRSARSTFRRR